MDRHLGGGFLLGCGVHGARHAVADEVAAGAASPRGLGPCLPAEPLRAPGVAVTQVLVREGQPAIRIDIGVVAQAQFDRIDVELARQLVERGLQRPAARQEAWPAQSRWGSAG